MMTRTRDHDFSQGPLLKKFVMFSLPILAMNMLQLLFNAVDMIVAGRFVGHRALGAVGASGAQVRRRFLAEAVILGVLGSLVGVAAGIGLAALAAA